ncbi:MAG TPA: hypothetical protein VL882_28085 [Vicinamibacterales bacterium]|jgi:hypothetical protein|nr:hypothetical protein [Vicinamibacterales bacterium]
MEVAMVNRTAAACLFCGVLVGYLLAGASVRAQNVPTTGAPVTVFGGDDVVLQFGRDTHPNATSMRCRVVAVEGSWIKCGSADGFGVDRIQKWINFAYVIQVTKTEK